MNGETDLTGMPEMEEEFYQKHFIRVDGRNRIVRGYSDVAEFSAPPPGDGETDILISGKGGRHFRLMLDGGLTHENPWELMQNEEGIPLLEWDAGAKKIARRAEEEIRADMDAIPAPGPAAPVEERLARLETASEYYGKAIGFIMGGLPKAQQAQVMQLQEAMFGAALDG